MSTREDGHTHTTTLSRSPHTPTPYLSPYTLTPSLSPHTPHSLPLTPHTHSLTPSHPTLPLPPSHPTPHTPSLSPHTPHSLPLTTPSHLTVHILQVVFFVHIALGEIVLDGEGVVSYLYRKSVLQIFIMRTAGRKTFRGGGEGEGGEVMEIC